MARGTRAIPRLLSAYRIEVKLDVDVVVLARPPAAPRRRRPRLRRGRPAPGRPARRAAPAVGLHRPAQGQSVGVTLGGEGPARGWAGLTGVLGSLHPGASSPKRTRPAGTSRTSRRTV